MRNPLSKKCAWLLVIGIVGLISCSCAERPSEEPAQSVPSVASAAQVSEKSQKRETFVYPSENVWIETNRMGKHLLKEYNVQYNQTIRFPYDA